MAHSFNYRQTSDLREKKYDANADRALPGLSVVQAGVLAGTIFLGILLLWSWSLDNLFMTELLAISGIWLMVSLVKLQSETKNSIYEKR